MATPALRSCLFAVSTSTAPCGVEDFAWQMLSALQKNEPACNYEPLAVSGQWRELPRVLRIMSKADSIVFNLPMVAWKRTIVLPCVLLLFAFFRRLKIFVFLHEWEALNPLRRIVLMPFIVFSNTIILLSPYIQNQFTSDPWVRWARKKCALALHAPTIRRPEGRRITEIVRRVEQRRNKGTIVIGQFGAIYKGKGTDALLDVCACLCGRGNDATVVFIGGITKSLDGYETDFLKKVKDLKLENRVIVTGYLREEEELFAIFDRIDVFLYVFPEGLTARRSSVLASVQSGRPVVVSAPTIATEFNHHAGYTSLIEGGGLVFFPPSASVEDLATSVSSAAAQRAHAAESINYDAWWKQAARRTAEILAPQA